MELFLAVIFIFSLTTGFFLEEISESLTMIKNDFVNFIKKLVKKNKDL